MDEEELSILHFNNKKKISFKDAYLPPMTTTHVESSSDSESSYTSGDGDRPRRRRSRKRSHRSGPTTVGGNSGSLASRLMRNKAVVIDDDDEDSDGDTSPTKKRKGSGSSKDVYVLDSPNSSLSPHSSSPSPQPSPPPPGCYLDGIVPTDKKSRKVLDKANNVLNQLRYSGESYSYSSPSIPDYTVDLNDSVSSGGGAPPFRLRIRCRGKIHKFSVYKTDPFSHACTLLLVDLKEDISQQVLLSHKTATIKQTESPDSLGLTTADILDAAIMAESSIADTSGGSLLNESQDSITSGGDNITVTLRSSKKSTTYSLAKSQPLQKAMTAFASELGISITKLKFFFDGDPIDPTKTAEDMDMENEDCIDVTVSA